jgi:SulP family sulfate permease
VITIYHNNLASLSSLIRLLSASGFSLGKPNVFVLKKYVDADGVKHYEIYGPLFFASTTVLRRNNLMSLNDPEEVVIDSQKAKLPIMSTIDAVLNSTERIHAEAKRFIR